MHNLNDTKVFLISPKFFGYENEIKNELQNKGAEVFIFDERPFTTSTGKILLRLNFNILTSFFVNRYYDKIIDSVKLNQPEYVFFVNPESVTPDIILKIRACSPKTKIFVYMWDSVKNKKKCFEYVNYVDKFYTFDSNDIDIMPQAGFLPLFYIEDYAKVKKSAQSLNYNCCFIGTAHSDRFSLVNRIISQSSSTKNDFVFFYCPSKLLFVVKKLFTAEFNGLSLRDVSFDSLKKDKLFEIISRSNIIIDIVHPNQSGLTMRTIEMLGAGKKLITTNSEIIKYDFYNENNISIIERDNPKIDISFFDTPYQELNDNVYHKYSLSNWIDTIFS